MAYKYLPRERRQGTWANIWKLKRGKFKPEKRQEKSGQTSLITVETADQTGSYYSSESD